MADTVHKIGQLPCYRRLPGAYFVVRVDKCSDAIALLAEAGISAWLEYYRADPRTEHIATHGLRRCAFIHPGDYITFRRDPDAYSGWSVISYRKADFECRYAPVLECVPAAG